MSLFMMISLLMMVPGIALIFCRFEDEIDWLTREYYSAYLIRKTIITGACIPSLPLWFPVVCWIEFLLCRDLKRSVIVNYRFVKGELFSGFGAWNRFTTEMSDGR